MTAIACSLTANQFRRRLEEASGIAATALRARRPIDGGERLIFDDDAGVRLRLEEIVAAEAACCPFLALGLTTAPGKLVLDVTGPPEAAPIIEALFA